MLFTLLFTFSYVAQCLSSSTDPRRLKLLFSWCRLETGRREIGHASAKITPSKSYQEFGRQGNVTNTREKCLKHGQPERSGSARPGLFSYSTVHFFFTRETSLQLCLYNFPQKLARTHNDVALAEKNTPLLDNDKVQSSLLNQRLLFSIQYNE